MSFKQLALAVALTLGGTITSIAQTPQIDSKYDRFEDKTTVQLDFMKVTGGKFDGIQINAAYQCAGRVKFCKPERVYLGVLVVLKGYKYDLPAKLAVLADEERFSIGNMTNLGASEVMPGWSIYGTSLLIAVPYETFVKIAKAKKVEMRLDGAEFELNKEQRSAFYDFAILMLP